jgi:hypothetical protein
MVSMTNLASVLLVAVWGPAGCAGRPESVGALPPAEEGELFSTGFGFVLFVVRFRFDAAGEAQADAYQYSSYAVVVGGAGHGLAAFRRRATTRSGKGVWEMVS